MQGYDFMSLTPSPRPNDPDLIVAVQDLTIRHGMALQGGGIVNHGDLTLIRTTVHDNVAVNSNPAPDNDAEASATGGAIYSTGPLHLERSTLSGNRSEFQGGAIYNAGSASDSVH